MRTVEIFERTSQTLSESKAIVAGSSIRVPLSVLTDRWGLKRKDLPEGRVGICRDDVCVPFSTGTDDDALRHVGDMVFVPVARLVQGFRGGFVWDEKAGDLLVDLTARPTRKSAAVGQTLNLALPDLDGNAVKLSAFHGKKILLFAWASW